MSDSIYRRVEPDGRVIEVVPLTFGRALVTIGDGHTFYDDQW